MPKKVNVKGVIVSNDAKRIYEWFGIDAVTPADVQKEIDAANGDDLEVDINSPGGDVWAGSEIYTMLKSYAADVVTRIIAVAASAAGIVAMAGKKVLIAPTAEFMMHNVSSITRGDYRDMQHSADMLKDYNSTIANAYMIKSGMSKEELLVMMDKETWLTPQQALDYKLVDEIMFMEQAPRLAASFGNGLLPPEVIEKVRSHLKQGNNQDELSAFIEDRCTMEANEKAPASALYEAYCNWCEESEELPMSQKRFGGQLAERGFENKRGTGGPYWWHGVGLVKGVNDDGQGSPSLTDNDSALLKAKAKLNLLKLKGETR